MVFLFHESKIRLQRLKNGTLLPGKIWELIKLNMRLHLKEVPEINSLGINCLNESK